MTLRVVSLVMKLETSNNKQRSTQIEYMPHSQQFSDSENVKKHFLMKNKFDRVENVQINCLKFEAPDDKSTFFVYLTAIYRCIYQCTPVRFMPNRINVHYARCALSMNRCVCRVCVCASAGSCVRTIHAHGHANRISVRFLC